MSVESRYSRKHLVPATVTAVIAAIGVAGFLFTHFGPDKEAPGGITMNTTAVVEEAGAILIPTGPM